MLYKYQKADKYCVVNDGDPDLTPIKIPLPEEPLDKKSIINYGMPPQDQIFRREQYPQRLKDLEKSIIRGLKKEQEKNTTKKVTTIKIRGAFEEYLSENKVDYADEIAWIQKQWYFRLYGQWQYINGKPVYIPGVFFFFLNYWFLDGTMLPDYRDRDRRWFLFADFIYTNTHDEQGNDLGYRTFYGFNVPKHRRAGDTNKALCYGYHLTTQSYGANGGIQSFDETNAKTQFRDKLIPAWRKMPLFFRPVYDGSEAPAKSLENKLPKNVVDGDSLSSYFSYADTPNRKFYDGQKLRFILRDEEGKTLAEDIFKRWDVVKETLGEGSEIAGFTIAPSTVGDMKSGGGEAFHKLCEQSNFYERNSATGQTTSGLARLFLSAADGLQGFIGKYGESIIDAPTPAQAKFIGKTIGAKEYLQSQLDALLEKGDIASMEKYYSRLELFPLYYADAFRVRDGNIGFDIEQLDLALAHIRKNENLTIRGNFEWYRGERDTHVVWKEHPQGKWEISKLLLKEYSNKRVKMDNGHFRPNGKAKMTVGIDPTKFHKEGEVKRMDMTTKHSQGAITVFEGRDKSIDTDNTPVEQWQTYNFICTYLNYNNDDDVLNEDCLMTCVYFNGMCFPEANIESTYKYFLKRKYGGYLKYRIDPFTGKRAAKPGLFSLDGSKQELFTQIAKFIKWHGSRCVHYELVKQWKEIPSIDMMKKFDFVAASGMSLVGDESEYDERLGGDITDAGDIEDWFPPHKY